MTKTSLPFNPLMLLYSLSIWCSFSQPAVYGAHLLLLWPAVCCCGEKMGLGLRTDRHLSARSSHQLR